MTEPENEATTPTTFADVDRLVAEIDTQPHWTAVSEVDESLGHVALSPDARALIPVRMPLMPRVWVAGADNAGYSLVFRTGEPGGRYYGYHYAREEDGGLSVYCGFAIRPGRGQVALLNPRAVTLMDGAAAANAVGLLQETVDGVIKKRANRERLRGKLSRLLGRTSVKS